MSSENLDMTLYIDKNHKKPHRVLLLTIPNEDNRHINFSKGESNYQSKKPQIPHIIGLHVKNLDLHDTSYLSYGWQRYSNKTRRVNLAPDVAYRNTYLRNTKQEENNKNYENNHDYHSKLSNQKQKTSKYSTIYDYLRASFQDIEHSRNSTQQNLSPRVKRPQNDDSILRRALADKRSLIKTSISRSSSNTRQSMSSAFNDDFKSQQSFVNYINYSRASNSLISNKTKFHYNVT